MTHSMTPYAIRNNRLRGNLFSTEKRRQRNEEKLGRGEVSQFPRPMSNFRAVDISSLLSRILVAVRSSSSRSLWPVWR